MGTFSYLKSHLESIEKCYIVSLRKDFTELHSLKNGKKQVHAERRLNIIRSKHYFCLLVQKFS